jgi:hypothetical protein
MLTQMKESFSATISGCFAAFDKIIESVFARPQQSTELRVSHSDDRVARRAVMFSNK